MPQSPDVRNLVRSRQATPLARGGDEVRTKNGRIPDWRKRFKEPTTRLIYDVDCIQNAFWLHGSSRRTMMWLGLNIPQNASGLLRPLRGGPDVGSMLPTVGSKKR